MKTEVIMGRCFGQIGAILGLRVSEYGFAPSLLVTFCSSTRHAEEEKTRIVLVAWNRTSFCGSNDCIVSGVHK